MISQLTGQISYKGDNYVILNVSGIGYKIFVTAETSQELQSNQTEDKITLWTHLAVRENSLDLYGFLNKTDLNFFEMLITISGIGPKTALGILNVATTETLVSAISSKDTSYLTKVSGIGQKNAEKIILELKNKISNFEDVNQNNQGDIDVLEALKTLGYSNKDAVEALKKIDKKTTDVGDKIKEALKFL
jgi:holliday junction DNA helicase RuvA